ncbi:hypothetical protein ESY86_03625 [Subsaximicrobium wynnwilliamsii]|uniref:Protease complex subunit PrcB family protein n=1 Tax=Subsaximicrobium wynnwilliamsii TaxID=291179 RepID=A0A5C6ZM53_9FLAO|nr:hypothetical protein [Subsaximicrobium wynnwilliamsii]TXD84796.1 hypothetical protein ESY87_03405 [Subsaximicrobium wynnwilliamsii]TXD90467.1 hypothetical protein ESY86_03625 [Subsaximicrobium wynnwilliamsii]TXE04943.1 hypothetical protein ESY88_01935 [Subsaximicrobium wynnwilliamsii]
MKTRILLFLLGIGLLNSCVNDDNADYQSTEINFTEIGKGALFGNGQEGISQSNLTISNTNEWQNLISQMNSVNNVSENFTETDINFNEFTVFAIFLEVKGHGWEIGTENVIENENNISVTTLENEAINSVMTQPFSIIKIPKTEKTIIVE